MAPGQYLEHAAAAGYDLTKDPLIRLKREEVLVENRLAALQQARNKSVAAHGVSIPSRRSTNRRTPLRCLSAGNRSIIHIYDESSDLI